MDLVDMIGDDIDRAGPWFHRIVHAVSGMAGTPEHHCATFGPAQFGVGDVAFRARNDQGLGEAEHVNEEPDRRRCVVVAQGGPDGGSRCFSHGFQS